MTEDELRSFSCWINVYTEETKYLKPSYIRHTFGIHASRNPSWDIMKYYPQSEINSFSDKFILAIL